MKSIILAVMFVAIVSGETRQNDLENLISLVQSGQGPAQLLVNHIDQLILAIRQEQLGHEDVYANQDSQCTEELTYRGKEVKDSSEDLARSEERKYECNSNLVSAKSYQALFTRYLTIFDEDQVDAKQIRVKEAASTQSRSDNYNYILETLDLADGIVNDWANNDASFLQVAQTFNKVVRQGAKVGMVAELGPVYALLAQVKQGGSKQDQAKRLTDLIQTIREKVQVDISELTEAENDSIVEYENRFQRDQEIIDALTEAQENLRVSIKELETCVSQETDKINNASGKFIRNKTILDSTEDLCNAFKNNLTSNSQDRAKEIETLGKLRQFVLTKAELFGKINGSGAVDVFSQYQSRAQDVFVQLTSNMRTQQ